VFTTVLDGLPHWLLQGVLLGIVLSVAVAALFYVGVRRFPGRGAAEVRETGSEARRREEIRWYLDAIDEPYAEDHVVEGQPVAFYLPERDVAITFDARAYYNIEQSPTTSVLVEHELPGIAIGTRLPFETPDISIGTGEQEQSPREAAYAVLGLPAGADDEEIRRAYRERIKEVHPDQGGDEEEFRRVQEAYAAVTQRAT